MIMKKKYFTPVYAKYVAFVQISNIVVLYFCGQILNIHVGDRVFTIAMLLLSLIMLGICNEIIYWRYIIIHIQETRI